MEQARISEMLQEFLGGRVVEAGDFQGQHWVTVKPDALPDALHYLRDTPDLDFNMLMDVSGVDYSEHPTDKEWRFEVAYQMYSLAQNHRFRIKVAVDDDTVAVPSVWKSWRTANWQEREVFDQYGVKFSGHPNLRRILNHDDFVGHPLRKDYPINRRQKLSRPIEHLLTDDPDWA